MISDDHLLGMTADVLDADNVRYAKWYGSQKPVYVGHDGNHHCYVVQTITKEGHRWSIGFLYETMIYFSGRYLSKLEAVEALNLECVYRCE